MRRRKQKNRPSPLTEDQKTLYALGVLMSQSLTTFDLKPEELVQVQKGLADGVAGVKSDVKAEEYIPKVQALQQARMAVVAEKAAGRWRRVPRQGRQGSRRHQDRERHGHQADQARHRRDAGGYRPGEGALRRPPHRRQGVRQLDRARRARRRSR